MEHSVKTSKNGSVDIAVRANDDDKNALLESFQKCQTGKCGCPTTEYSKIAQIEIDADASDINIRIQPKNDQSIDVTEIEKCLTWTHEQVRRK